MNDSCRHWRADQTIDSFKGADRRYHYTVRCSDCNGEWRDAGWELESERQLRAGWRSTSPVLDKVQANLTVTT